MAASSSTTTPPVEQTGAAGLLSFTQPPQTAALSYYKIAPSNSITFGWNFTSMAVWPEHLTVKAFCSANGNTYMVGAGTIDGQATQVIWDPWAYEQQPGVTSLAAAEYTIRIHDERGEGAGILGGHLTPYTGTRFSLYRPEKATPIESWSCQGCSSAFETATVFRPMTIALFATVLMVLLSGFNVLRRTT
ncbi:hypothetical protein FRC14_002772 [Serendipita sp. 396]|nr:hypothetical protein FRC14_002772 [Serendipita sp. 396]KAG8789683.1 hypothetical protein FRC15_003752 [Serendipita sp. 397]KAG8825784.1 hypothetical protein FRC19_010548 [Serendipita sp. 401]KAG8837006.1 hypothetical protein FRC18_010244 [Serendipita sp. 400]KAG8858308.1 hypothetical protein FRB91_010060 [Serendipita sp. 411]KAG8876299.1 hypothetical protein FRC20_001802 [Serendipita sp. 405]KAG9034665.1 hypothetical protein FS842_003785 [Serendipita sp. 407]